MVRTIKGGKPNDALNCEFFHGDTRSRDGYSGWAGHRPGEDLSEPMLVVRNGHLWPPVFIPRIDLVVSREVRALLNGLPNLAFCPVAFKVYHIPWTPGTKTRIKPNLLRLYYEDAGRFHQLMPAADIEPPTAYFEVVLYPYTQVIDRYPGAGSPRFDYPFSITLYRNAVLSIPPGLLEDYPITNSEYGLLIRNDVFARLDPYLNRDFFEVVHIRNDQDREP